MRLIVFGPSGSGKSTLCKMLSKSFHTFYTDIYKDYLQDKPREPDGLIAPKYFSEASNRIFWSLQDKENFIVELGVEPHILKRAYELGRTSFILVKADLNVRKFRIGLRDYKDRPPLKFIERQQELTEKLEDFYSTDLVIDTTTESISTSYNQLKGFVAPYAKV